MLMMTALPLARGSRAWPWCLFMDLQPTGHLTLTQAHQTRWVMMQKVAFRRRGIRVASTFLGVGGYYYRIDEVQKRLSSRPDLWQSDRSSKDSALTCSSVPGLAGQRGRERPVTRPLEFYGCQVGQGHPFWSRQVFHCHCQAVVRENLNSDLSLARTHAQVSAQSEK